MNKITNEMLEKYRASYEQDAHAKALYAAMSKTDLHEVSYVPANAVKLKGPFSLEVKTRGITAQRKSGRCWCFAGLNILREVVAEKYNMPEFKLSANYLTFYDKLEKANNYLEMIIANADKPHTDRMMEYLKGGIGDGGYWDMVTALVKKYGVVPDYVMPETFQSENTSTLNGALNTVLKKDAAILRREIAAGNDVTEMKEEMLGEVYKALCIAFGEPVAQFDFCYKDANGEYHADYDLTPKTFYEKYVGVDLGDYMTVTNEPTDRVPMNRAYTFHFSGNMVESDVHAMNVPLADFKELVIKQLEDDEPIWFACDAGKYGDRPMGIWDPECFDFGAALGGLDLTMSKEDRLNFGETHGNHAMLITGVNLDKNGEPNRWKIENSWGAELGDKGYFVCSDSYFDGYVVEAIINKKHLSEEQIRIMNSEPVVIKPWQTY